MMLHSNLPSLYRFLEVIFVLCDFSLWYLALAKWLKVLLFQPETGTTSQVIILPFKVLETKT